MRTASVFIELSSLGGTVPRSVSLVSLNQTSTFDPGIAGKVESITFNLDLMNIERTPKTDVYYAIVLLQDGLLYQSPPARLTSAQKWKSFVSEPLTETNFTPLMPSSPSAKPNFSSNAPTLQFGYMVHIAGVGSYLIKSITSIGEWKVSVAHRENSSASLSATQQLKLRFESELLERQLVERTTQEQFKKLREAENEINSLRMSLRMDERERSSDSLSGSGLNESGDSAPSGGNKYLTILEAARNRIELQHRIIKEKEEKARENMERTVELERQERQEVERKWATQYEAVARTAAEEKEQLSAELECYKKRIFHLEQELRKESQAKDDTELELHRLRQEEARKQEEADSLSGRVNLLTAALEEQKELAERVFKAMREQIQKLEEDLEQCKNAHQSKTQSWQDKEAELTKEVETCREELAESCKEHKRKELEMASTISTLEVKLGRAQTKSEHRKNLAEGLQKQLEALQHGVNHTVRLFETAMGNMRQEMNTTQAAREQAEQELEKARAEAKKQKDANRKLEEALAQERVNSQAGEEALESMETRTQGLLSHTQNLEARVLEMKRELKEKDIMIQSAEIRVADLEAQVKMEAERNKDLQQTLDVATEEMTSLEQRMSSQIANLRKELEALTESYEEANEAQKKLTVEFRAETEARMQAEKFQGNVISKLNEHMKKQTERIAVLEDALDQERSDRSALLEEMEEILKAKQMAEDTILRLNALFSTTKEEQYADWELVSSEK